VDGSIDTVHIGNLQITNPLIADDAVGADELATNAVVNASIASGAAIDATKIADGSVTSAEFQRINSLSDNAQTQLDAKAALASPTFTGNPVAPTQSAGNNSTRLATTAYVDNLSTGTSWQAVKTSAFTAVAGEGYPVNTTSGAITCTLPSSASVGDTIEFMDYARNFNTNNLTLNVNSLKYQGETSNVSISTDGQALTIVYVDPTKGWMPTNEDTISSPGYNIDYLVVAGGGGGGRSATNSGVGGGGGGGGLRSGAIEMALTGTVYTATVGTGGAGSGTNQLGVSGVASSLAASGLTTVTSTGGGYGNGKNSTENTDGADGGSGGGGGQDNSNYTQDGGSGNTPSTSPSQGNDGGDGGASSGGGGGGAGAAGTAGANSQGGTGGAGATVSAWIPTTNAYGVGGYFAGGGGGGTYNGANSKSIAAGGSGGGGAGGISGGSSGNTGAITGTVNTGGGGGGGIDSYNGVNGGSGVVILRVLTADYSATISGSPTVTTVGDYKLIKFTGTGSYTA